MAEPERFDAIIIGSGQAANPLARDLANAGWRTALIEREHVGGTCINEGCTPTKTMVASARVAYLARRGDDYGVHGSGISVDVARVRQRKRDIVESFRSGSERRLQQTPGISLIYGDGRFNGPHDVTVQTADGERRLTAPKIFLNTGTRGKRPPIPGLDSVTVLDNRTIMELDALPGHLLVLGGGYIGLEFAQM